MGAMTFLVGGARSGKSALAVDLGRAHDGAIVFIATAEPVDDDLRSRIERHRSERPDWPLVEEPVNVAFAVAAAPQGALLIVDCLTVWVANLLHRGEPHDAVLRRTTDLVAQLRARDGPAVVVSNEVGMGVHPETDLGRAYRDLLGTVNRVAAAGATRALLLVAGRALPLVEPAEALR